MLRPKAPKSRTYRNSWKIVCNNCFQAIPDLYKRGLANLSLGRLYTWHLTEIASWRRAFGISSIFASGFTFIIVIEFNLKEMWKAELLARLRVNGKDSDVDSKNKDNSSTPDNLYIRSGYSTTLSTTPRGQLIEVWGRKRIHRSVQQKSQSHVS